MKKYLVVLFVFLSIVVTAQQQEFPTNNFQNEFNEAYDIYPDIPKGVLEAVAFTTTRFQHINNLQPSCTGIPPVYGVMGLTLDGQNYFRNNLNQVSQLSGISVNDIIEYPGQNILAYASAYSQLLSEASFDKTKIENHTEILIELSELPYNGVEQDFALNTHLYATLNFINNPAAQIKYGFPNHLVNLETVFGAENLKVLSSSKIVITENTVSSESGKKYENSNVIFKSVDYPPALTNLTPCNFSSRNGTAISAVTIHTIQGTYAGAISWAHNCSVPANVSYHYVLRSSDGQVTQVVLESDKGWHVGSANPYTIGMEHDGYVSDSTWYSAALYQSSADVVKDITQSGYGINPLRAAYFPWARTTNYNVASIPGDCVTIKGHQHYPSQSHTDPGQYWDWDYYYKLLNITTPIVTSTSVTGTTTDVGGTIADYVNDERTLFLIQPDNAESITLTVNQFDVEATWDYLYIYDGTTPFDTKIGVYTGTTIPSSITVNSGNVLIEFRSDCATINPGYEITWTAVIADTIKPTAQISSPPNPATTDFLSNFTDADNIGGSGVKHQFYQVADDNGTEWRSNLTNGFYNDEFDNAIHTEWIDSSGIWGVVGGYLAQTDEVNTNTNIYASCNQNTANKFLYTYQTRLNGVGANKRAGFHYMCDDASQSNRGNSYFVWFRQDDAKLQFYKVVNNVFSLEKDVPLVFNANQWYDIKIVYDKTTGETEVWMDDEFISSWVDGSPITLGNYISLRSGNTIYDVDELQVYKNRTSSETITVGSGPSDDLRYSGTPAGRINSIVIDSAYNVSNLFVEFVNVDLTTGIDGLSESDFSVYPNPFFEKITIQTKSNELLNVEVTNANGKLVYVGSPKVNNNQITIDLSQLKLASGNYYLKLSNDNLSKTISLIKN